MEPQEKIVLGIDLGGTKIAGGVFDTGTMISPKSVLYIEKREGEEVGELILELISQLLEWTDGNGLAVSGAGIAVPGIYHSLAGTVWAPNISGWEDYPLRQELCDELAPRQIDISIDSDRSCYILGETWRGAAEGCKNAIFLAVGTGIGAGIMVDGRLIRGANNIAGAVGWLALTDPWLPEYEDCGCFEYHASGTGIARRAREVMEGDPAASDVFKAYNAGDPDATEIIRLAVRFWGKACANLVSLFNPEKIIFGGGVFGPGAQLLDEIYKEAGKWAQPMSIGQAEFVTSQLEQDAGIYGAAKLALMKDQK